MQINGKDVTTASHETVVGLIRKSGDVVKLTVVTVPNFVNHMNKQQQQEQQQQQQRHFSTLPRGATLNPSPSPSSSASVSTSGGSGAPPPPPPKRDPNTTLSVGRAKARSMVANLSAIGESGSFALVCQLF